MRSRLGDDIDDFCIKCKRVMYHAVVSLLYDEPAKVRCKTCYSDHDFRHEQPPPPRVDPRKASLFNQVLETLHVPGEALVEAPAEPASEPEVETVEAVEAVVAAPKPKGRRKSGA